MPERKKIEVTVSVDSPIETKNKQLVLQRIADLSKADFDRISQLASNKKALSGLAEHWSMLKGMFS